MAQPEPIACGTAGKDQRRECQRIGIGNPLRLGKAGAEVDADRRHGDRQDRSVDEAERRGQDRRDQDITPLRLRAERAIRDRSGQRNGGGSIGRMHVSLIRPSARRQQPASGLLSLKPAILPGIASAPMQTAAVMLIHVARK
ncbi:hypothetical protein ACVWWD_000805 [Mesorhizobium sp. URHB0026]